MIEFEMDKERNLKNLKQIGTPKEENKIYIEHMAYAKMKESSYKEKRVFILMGHTERMNGKYMTFIEGVIPVREMDFQGNTPRWNNSTWSEIFREIRRLYEDMIIVGWALDIKGMSPKVSPELERVHREHFGGIHQVLFLLNTMEQEEAFYIYKDNKVVSKDGFYIYHRARKKETIIPIKVHDPKYEVSNKKEVVDVEVDILQEKEAPKVSNGGKYRQLVIEKKTKTKDEDGNLGVAIAVAMLIFVIGVGVYEDRDKIFGPNQDVQTNIIQENDFPTDLNSETTELDDEVSIDVIPVDRISGTEDSGE